jgi:hypothetical protein
MVPETPPVIIHRSAETQLSSFVVRQYRQKDARHGATSNLDTKVSHTLELIIPLDGCLSFVALRFQSVRCGNFPIPMWLKAEGARMQFTRFPGRCTTGGTTHGVYLLHGDFGSHSAFVFLLKRWLNR